MEITPIAYAHNGFTDKFGIPRQSREESTIETRIVFEPQFRVREALRGIEGFSHLWLIWEFSEVTKETESVDDRQWQPTVRPPRLGGNKRMGVFATRSPYRPNRLGLSSVRLLRVEETKEGLTLVVTGADLLDGTPVYDIKPYLSFSDSHPDAQNGFAEETRDYKLKVAGIEVTPALREILEQDPRPSYHDDPGRAYKLDFDGKKVTFHVMDGIVFVDKLE